MSTINVEIVTPEKLLCSASASLATIPGEEGYMGILPNHAPLISNLKPGIVELSSDSEAAKRYFVAEGFVEVSAERCTILATNALDVEGLSVADVDSMIAEQKALLEKSYNEEESLKVEKEIDFLTGLSSALSATA